MNTTNHKSDGLFLSSTKKAKHFSPLANIHHRPDEYVLTIAAPGFQRSQFAVTINKDILTVSTINKDTDGDTKEGKYEYDYSHWQRKFILPDNADATMMVSNYFNGELIIRIPKYSEHILHEDVMSVAVY